MSVSSRPYRREAPGSRPGPSVRRNGTVLRDGLLPLSWLGVRCSLLLRSRIRGGRQRLLGCAGFGRLARLRVAGETCRVLVPVPGAHPAEPVLLTGLLGEVLERRLVALDPEPGRADAPAQ